MLSLGWAEITTDGHFKIKGVGKLKEKKDAIIQVPILPTKKAQLLQFRYSIIKNNLTRQQDKITRKTNLVKKSRTPNQTVTKKEYKVITRAGGVNGFEKSILKRVTLSNKRFGSLLNRSQATGKTYQKRMKTARLIESKCFYDALGVLPSNCLAEARKAIECYYLIVDNGLLKKRSSNTITPLD